MKLQRKYIYLLLFFIAIALVELFDLFQLLFALDQGKSIALSILIIAAFLWVTEWVPLFITSMIILLLQLCWLLPVINPAAGKIERQVYLSPFFSDIILLFLGGFVLAAMLHKYGLDNRIASWLLKKTGTKPSRILMGIMLVSAILSMWMSNTATTAMMFAIILPIVDKIPKENRFSLALLLGIPFACNLGGLGTPIGTPPNAIAMSFLAEKGLSISFFGWMLAAVPLMLVLLVVVWFLLLKFYAPGDLEIQFEEKSSDEFSAAHWLVIGLFFVTVLGWLTTKTHGFSLGTVSLIPVIFTFGVGLLTTRDFKNLPWDVLFMVGGGICLGVGLRDSGLTKEMIGLIPTHISYLWVLVAFLCLTALMTTFMSNTATANLLIPIAVSTDFDILMFVIPIAMVCSTAMALPISTPPNAIAFGSGLLESKDMMKPGAVITIISILIIIALGLFYLPQLGL